MTTSQIAKSCQRGMFICLALWASVAFASDGSKTITFGMYATAGTAPFTLAEDAGYFKAEGITKVPDLSGFFGR